MTQKKIGELLQEAQVITSEQLQHALQAQRETGELIGETMLRLKMVDVHTLATMLALQHDVEAVDLEETPPAADALALMRGDEAMKLGCLPYRVDGDTLYVALANPNDTETLARVAAITGKRVVGAVTPQTSLYHHLQMAYADAVDSGKEQRREILTHLMKIKYHVEQLEELLDKEK